MRSSGSAGYLFNVGDFMLNKKKKKASRKSRPAPPPDWRKRLYRKTFHIEAWDWKADPKPYIRALCQPFNLRPSLKPLDPEDPGSLLQTIADQHGLHLYDIPSIEGSDVYGFILAREALNKREIQQIEADYWGEDFDEVYC